MEGLDSDSNERSYRGAETDTDSDENPEIPTESFAPDSNKRKLKPLHWNIENTYKLIELWKTQCRELWDPKNPTYRDRIKRIEKQEFLANCFDTTPEEIARKLHNLRSQYNNELRKIKKKRMSGVAGSSDDCSWEYFEPLSFLVPISSATSAVGAAGTSHQDPLEFNVALAEFQAKEEEQFKTEPRDASPPPAARSRTSFSRIPESAPPPLPPHAHPMVWTEEPMPRSRSNVNTSDECQIFGDFVASELRSLKSDESRKKLKRIIQKAILQVGEDEDVNMMCG